VDENARSAVAATLVLDGLSGGTYRIKTQSKFEDASGCSESTPFEVLSNGQLRLKSTITAGLSAEQCTGYEVVVAYHWRGNDVTTCTMQVETNDLNERPTFGAASYARDVEEDQPEDTQVGEPITATDPDRGQELQYTIISGNTGDVFRIGSCSGQIFTTEELDHEGTSSYTLRIRATDSGTPQFSVETTVRISVTNRNEEPTFPESGDYTFEVNEDAGVGGAFSPASAGAVDPDGDSLTYSLIGNDQAAVTINSGTGALTIAKTQHFNFELPAQQVRSFRIKACDAEFCAEQDAMVTTINRNDQPVVTPNQRFFVGEDQTAGGAVGTVLATDEDDGSTLTYSIVSGNTGAVFAIAGSTGAITVATGMSLDHETTPSYSLVIRATDDGITGHTTAKNGQATVSITVDDVNEAPQLSNLAATVEENDATAEITPLLPTGLSDPDGLEG